MWAFESLLIWAETLISFITKLRYKTQHKCMHEHCFFFFNHFKQKKPCQYILLNRSMLVHKEKHVAMLRIMGGMTKDMNENKIKD
jgi:hypothetical protein